MVCERKPCRYYGRVACARASVDRELGTMGPPTSSATSRALVEGPIAFSPDARVASSASLGLNRQFRLGDT